MNKGRNNSLMTSTCVTSWLLFLTLLLMTRPVTSVVADISTNTSDRTQSSTSTTTQPTTFPTTAPSTTIPTTAPSTTSPTDTSIATSPATTAATSQSMTEESTTATSDLLVCTPSSMELVMAESIALGTCLTPTADGSEISCVPSLSSETQQFNVQGFAVLGGLNNVFNITQTSTARGFFINICVNNTTGLVPGEYQISVLIQYGMGENSENEEVRLNVSVTDTNEAPDIAISGDSFAVEENVPIGTAIFTFNVTDPDARNTNGSEAFRNISEVRLLQTDGAVPKDFAVQELSQGMFQVVVNAKLNASRIISYSLQITASDSGGLNTAWFLTVNVADVNEAPYCTSYNVTIVVTHLTPVGSVVGKLDCWDPDVTSPFDQLEFSPSSLFSSLVTIDSHGNMTLAVAVSMVSVSRATDVSVFAPGYPNISATVSISLRVKEVPPECSTSQGTLNLPDDIAVGTCPTPVENAVNCMSNGEDSRLTVSLGRVDPILTWSITRGNLTVDSSLSFAVCVTHSLYHFVGEYQLLLEVSNSTGMTSVDLSVTVDDVNQPPIFLNNVSSSIYVSDNTPVGTSVGQVDVITSRSDVTQSASDVIYVWDPDNVTDAFEFSNVSFVDADVTYPDLSTNKTSIVADLPIFLVTTSGPPYVFYTQQALSPGYRVTLKLQATDKMGENDVTSVTFIVPEVNTPPTCGPTPENVTVSLVTSAGVPVYSLSCTDDDVTAALAYVEILGDSDEYFTIDQNGTVSLQRLLPIDVTTMTYEVNVTDSEGLSTNVTIYFVINRNFPPECVEEGGTVTLVQTYNGTQCQTVTLACGHEASLNSYGLAVNVSFHYDANLFEVRPSNATTSVITRSNADPWMSQSSFRVCSRVPHLNRSEHYNLTVRAASQLGATSYPWTIVVQYVNQPPAFSQSNFSFTIPEDAANGSVVAQVIAATAESDWDLTAHNGVYLLDPDTDPGFTLASVTDSSVDHYQADGTVVPAAQGSSVVFRPSRNFVVNGTFTVNGQLTPGHRHVFVLTARDAAGAEASTTVTMVIDDVNQAPSCQSDVTVTIELTTAVGVPLDDASCNDVDTDPQFSNLTYGEYSVGGYDYFSIDPSKGVVKLTSQVPTNVSQLSYDVFVRDGGGLTANVTFTFNINRNFAPQCSPATPIYVTFLETDTSGTCSQTLVTCDDTSGRNLLLTVDVISDATGGKITLRSQTMADRNSLMLEACVNASSGSLLPLGQFQLQADVSNTLNVTSLTFNVTIADVNQRPSFEFSDYSLSVAEDLAAHGVVTVAVVEESLVDSQDVILSILYSDPDASNTDFAIGSLKYELQAKFVNGTNFVLGNSQPIRLNRSNIVVTEILRPDVIYNCTLTVTDRQNKSDSATLLVTVRDVNQPPSCPQRSQVNLDLLEPVQSLVFTLDCSDPDYNTTFRWLSYFSYADSNQSFFDVSENGDVTLVMPVPRDVTVLELEAYAVDGGGLRDNVTVVFNIARNYTPQCFPAYVPPTGVWEINTCFRLYPNCSDPSTADGDKTYLTYSFNGTWRDGFRMTETVSTTQDFARFCYTLTHDGIYEVLLDVSNGLGVYQWQGNIHVVYKDAPPNFNVNMFVADVRENANVSSPVLRVQALVDGRNASLVYSLQGSSSSVVQYFAINNSTGQIYVAANLAQFAASTVDLQVTAEDPSTGLNHSVPLRVSVKDVNQPPSCHPSLLTASVPWSVSVNDTVVKVNCTDLDPSPGFSTLSYQVRAGNNIWRSEEDEVRLISRAVLNPRQLIYILSVVASDGVFSATTTVTVNIDKTPPRPVVTVSSVQATNVTISWTMDDLYLPVIVGFTITITTTTTTTTLPPRHVDKDVRSDVIGGLTSETVYSVRVTVKGLTHNVTSNRLIFWTPAISILSEYCTEIHLLSVDWNPEFLNNQSSAFTSLSNNLTTALDTAMRGLHGYVGARVRSFRQGSVLSDVVMVTNQSLSGRQVLRSTLHQVVGTGSISGIPVNSSHYPFYTGGYYIVGTTLTYTSPGKIINAKGISGYDLLVNGSDVTATCSARTPGFWHPVFEWRLKGRDVGSLSGRYRVSPTVSRSSDPFFFSSSLTIQRISSFDSGALMCKVTAGTKQETSVASFMVVDSLAATLTPLTSVVTSGTDVTFRCERIAGYDASWQASLIRVEDRRGIEVDKANMTQNDNHTEFFVAGVTSDASYQCDVTDKYGSAASNEANVIIRQEEEQECPADGDWMKTPAGHTVQLSCPQGHTGIQKRTCDRDGVWGDVDTSQCVRDDLVVLLTLVDQIEEGGESNLTGEVVQKLANSTSGSLLAGDVITSVAILEKVANITTDNNQRPDDTELQDFLKSADNVLHAPTEVWRNQTPVALNLVHSVDEMGRAAASSADADKNPIETNKIVLEVGNRRRGLEDIVFPNPNKTALYPDWLRDSNNSVFLSRHAFADSVEEVKYSTVMYRNLTNVFSSQLSQQLTGQNELSINSPIVALSIIPSHSIHRPVLLTFGHITSNFSTISCQFLDLSGSENAVWSSRGCWVKVSDSVTTVCECDHLTNFAVLMSPYRPTETVADVLNIFSVVGCSVSIFCLLLTIIIYYIFWRYVKSDRSVILVNLCVILILAYVTFLAGVNRVENKIACTVVAALLHYLWLVVFFLMLCEGLDIFISIVIVFPTKSVLLKLLLMAYGVPLIIVGASLGITQLEGYGGSDFCWLSLDQGLLWAFVGPALAALLANFVFVALVIRALLSTTAMITKASRERAKSVLKAICVMTPILGLAWIFGVMAVNNDTLVFQVLFVVFNSLQGLMIFIFHCLLSKQVREGLESRRRQRQAKSKYSTSGDSAASRYLSQKQTSESSLSANDLGKTSSPFLQIDRQVQQMAAKVNMMDSPNLLTSDDPPKGVVLKNPVAGATGPGAVDPFLNIQLTESTTDDADAAPQEPLNSSRRDSGFRIETGNLSTFSPLSSPAISTSMSVLPSAPATTITTTTTRAVVEKESLRQKDSLEDNEIQAPIPLQVLQTSLSGSGSGDSRGSKHSNHRQGHGTPYTGDNSRDVPIGRLQRNTPRRSTSQEEQQSRLDQVYGPGARITGETNTSGRPYVKHKGKRPVQSADNVAMMSAPKNPIYSDVMPSLAPTDRWIRAAQTARHQQQQQPRGHQRPAPGPASFHQPRPSSPRRMTTSAESLESTPFQPFSAPRQGDVRYPRSKRAHPPPQVAPKPYHHEPPVDYW